MVLTKEKRLVIIIGAAMLAVLITAIIISAPLVAEYRQAGHECGSVEKEVLLARETIGLLERKAEKKTLIPEKDISMVIDELTKRGRSNGINFTSIAPGKIENPAASGYKIIPIEVDLESTYKEMAVFLGLLEELERGLVTVRNINITDGGIETTKLNTKLVLNMYLSGR